jgi:hypothetical protein
MNFTNQYIRMCFNARELQQSWSPEVGDWVSMMTCYCSNENNACTKKEWNETCIDMSNRYVLSGNHYKRVFFFNPTLCGRNEGGILNETKASVFIPNQADSLQFALKLHTYQPTHQEEVIWTPTQNQLQEFMHSYLGEGTLYVMDKFMEFLNNVPTGNFTSLEECWLLFYMHHIHGKRWTEKEWRGEEI